MSDMNYTELSDNFLRNLSNDGDARATEELQRRIRILANKIATDKADKEREAYIKRRGGEPHIPNAKVK